MSDLMKGETNVALPSMSAAERMRRYRQRQRNGLRCALVELRQTEIETLIRLGYLKGETRSDDGAVIAALYQHLEVTLI